MRILVDASILFKAVLGSKSILPILTFPNHSVHAPAIIKREVGRYADNISGLLRRSSEEIYATLDTLLLFIRMVERPAYVPHLKKATELIKDRDIADADYIAAALAIDADFIWTEDTDFTTQDLVPVKTTDQFIFDQKHKGENGE